MDRDDFMKTVKDDLDFASSTLTDRSRAISLGIVVLCWAFMIGEIPKDGHIAVPIVNLLGPTVLALCSILSDYLQYVFGYFCSFQLFRQIEQAKSSDNLPEYDENSSCYKARFTMFYAKQVFCLGASLWFLISVLYSLWSIL